MNILINLNQNKSFRPETSPNDAFNNQIFAAWSFVARLATRLIIDKINAGPESFMTF